MSNPTKQPIKPSETVFNDHDIIHDSLATIKSITTSLATFKQEASTDSLLKTVCGVLDDCFTLQRELFLVMYDKGWYALEAENEVVLKTKYQQFTGYKNQL